MAMNYCDMFDLLGNIENNPSDYTPDVQFTEPYQIPAGTGAFDSWSDAFNGFKTRPALYNVDGYISPYASNNWGATSDILQTLDDESRLPPFENKIDPNKIFTAETNGLRSNAADQLRIVKMFEKKLVESLTEKGKVGLTETDIEAMSALTAARSAITAINKEQIAVKKNIADIRLKQQQNRAEAPAVGNTGTSYKGMSSVEIGRSILDSVFDAPASAYQASVIDVYSPTDVSKAEQVIDALVPNTSPTVKHEINEPTTYVLVGETDDDVDYVTYGSDGQIIPDYPQPDAKIDTIDRETGTAIDQYLVKYPIKYK